MQGIAIASTVPTAAGVNAGASAGSAAGVGADDSASGGANMFGAILAGQLKGRTIAMKVGLDGKMDLTDVGKLLGEKGKKATDGDIAVAKDALADMLALANSGMLAMSYQAPVPLEQVGLAEVVDTTEGQNILSEISLDGKVKVEADRQGKDAKGADLKKADGETKDLPMQVALDSVGEKPRQAEIAANGNTRSVRDSQPGVLPSAVVEDKPKDFAANLDIAVASQVSAAQDVGAQNAAIQMAQVVAPRQDVSQVTQSNTITPQVGSSEWGSALGDKVSWMASQGTQVAELHLNPPNLGPLEVRLTMNGDQQASVMFISNQPAVREAIETAMPRLREMLADSGIMLGNSMVGAESFQQQQQQQAHSQRAGGGKGNGEADMLTDVSGVAGASSSMVQTRSGRGMVDMFV